jgi:hypothetical protein
MLLQVSDQSKTIVQRLVDKTDWEILRDRLVQVGKIAGKC